MKKFLTLLIAFLLCAIQLKSQWIQTVIAEGLNMPTSFCLNDIDNDGDEDIVAALWGQNDIVWYEKNGMNWEANIIDNNLGAVGIMIVDLDNDGNKDIVAAGYSSDLVKWYRNMGGSPIEWADITIDDDLLGAEFIGVADFNNDGFNDIVASGAKADNLCWYKNDGTSENWTKTVIGIGLDGAITCRVADFNNDGLQDVVINARYGNKIVWYKNNNNAESWTEYLVDDQLNDPNNVAVGDMDNDGNIDIVATAKEDNTVNVYKNSGGDSISWFKYVVDDNITNAFAAIFVDIDNDNDLDIVATNDNSGEVILYENVPGVNTIDWTKSTIVSGLGQSWDIGACDVDNDGDKDLIMNQFITNGKIYAFLNPLIPNSLFDNTYNHATIYPNPNNGMFSVLLNSTKYNTIKFYNVQGRIIMEPIKFKDLEIQVDLSHFAKGIYFLQLSNKTNYEIKKLIIE